PIRFGLLVRESLRYRELPRLVGGASRLFGRALRLLRDASRFCGALRLRGALRLESATRFLLGRARLVLCNARLLVRGLRLLRSVLGSGADLVSGSQRAGQGVAHGGVELFVHRDTLARRTKLRFERADALGELADTIGERADDVSGRA